MWGFSKKRFLVTLGLSIGIWVVSNFVQLFNSGYWPGGFSLLGEACTLTGYPVALCISHEEKLKILFIYALNITIWFWIIHLFWGWFEKSQS